MPGHDGSFLGPWPVCSGAVRTIPPRPCRWPSVRLAFAWKALHSAPRGPLQLGDDDNDGLGAHGGVVQIRCLGSLAVDDGARTVVLGSPKQRLVLAHLLIRANEAVPTERLVGEVWGDDPPPSVRSSLHSYVSHLRKALGPDRIESRGRGYVLLVQPDEVDRLRFEALVDEGRRLRHRDAEAASTTLRDALDLWEGPPFADISDAPTLQPEITRLEEIRLGAVEERIAADLDRGLDGELIGELEVLTAAHPLRERLWGQLMVALYRSGRQGEALAAFDRARGVLVDELGVDPSPELQSMHQRILRQDSSLQPSMPVLKGYRLVERIGQGPAWTVWRATQRGVDREVAIKVAPPELANRADFIRHFDAQVQRVARIEHPHVLPVYDFWREPDGAYLVVRLLSGGDLGRVLDDLTDPSIRQRIAEHVAQALAAAHRQGVVHGELKPSNVLLDDEQNAYLSDFAIAADGTSTSDPSAPASDLRYLAPERIEGAPPDARSDVYAFGVLLSDLLPHEDGPVTALVHRATAREVDERPADAQALLVDLQAAVRPMAGHPLTGGARHPSGQHAVGTLSNPYKGLRPFREGDAVNYFGREAFVARLVNRLREDGPAATFLAVVGPSGSGKSSAVHAGLVPALRAGALTTSQGWYIVPMVPGERPFEELGVALRSVAVDPPDALADQLAHGGLGPVVAQVLPDRGELLLIIDQFEELFTLPPEAVRRRFIDALVAAVTDDRHRVRVVVTLRADFYDRPLEYPGLAELVQARTEPIVPMTATELERVVTGPAERVGVKVERPLVAEMVADMVDQPGALPLLQYALTELFDNRADGMVSVAAYRQIGGLAGALARRAETIFTGLAGDAQDAARQLFLRLVTPGEGVEDTRRRASIAELTAAAPEHMPTILSGFGAARLLSFDRDAETREPTAEIAHEALLREWGRLRRWIDSSRDDLRTQRRLQTAAVDWSAADHDRSFLATGSLLDEYQAWRSASGMVPTTLEHQYLEASLEERDRARSKERARVEREQALERRSVHRLRVLVGVLAVAAIIGGGLTVLAVTQARRAAAQAEVAAQQADVAAARELAAASVANLGVDPERSILLALEAIDRTRATDGTVLPEAEEALHRAVTASRIALRVPGLGGAVAWSPAADEFVTEGPEETGLIDIRSAATGESVRAWRGHDIDINDVAYSPDGSLLLTTGDDGTVAAWDPGTGATVSAYADGPAEVWGPAASPDNAVMAAAWPTDDVVRIIDVTTGRVRREIAIDNPHRTAFSPDGTKLAITSRVPGGLSIVDVASGDRVISLPFSTPVDDVSWSPDGRWIATAGPAETAHIFDPHTGAERSALHGAGPVGAIAWSADSTRLVTGAGDGSARVWELPDGRPREVLTLGALDTVGGIVGVAFSPDGQRILTGDFLVGAAIIWDIGITGDAEWANIPTAPDAIRAVAFTPDGRRLVAPGVDAAVTMWDARSGARIRDFDPGSEPALLLGMSGDGTRIGAAMADGTIRVWDAATGQRSWSMKPDAPINDLAVGDDPYLVATADMAGVARVYDGSGQEVRVLQESSPRVALSVALSPDGRRLAVTTVPVGREIAGEVPIRIWDVKDQRIVQSLTGDQGGMAFDRSGDRLVTQRAGVARIWDVDEAMVTATLAGHTGGIPAAAFSSDGSRVATTSLDGTVRLWDTASGRQILVLPGHQVTATSVAFSPDGSLVASAGADGLARVWSLRLDDLITMARNELTRDLTTEECRQYLHVDSCPTS